MAQKLKIGDVFRYSRPYKEIPDNIDGFPNHFAVTFSPGIDLAVLDSGINPILH